MTFGDLKDKLRDMGFEEDASMDEYKELVINAVNRSIEIIKNTVVSRLEGEDPAPFALDLESDDETEIDLPAKVIMLLPLLSAYYIWLDDDERKAVMYYNQYDDLCNQIFSERLNGTKMTITGGYRFG
ncbi:hypothetical protein D1155_10145 [Anaerotruncus sp. 80]|uniref:Uncharacterized protein n=1 Tax=Anaerotruncus colihominis TaxID=169435 RepID=A0A845QJF0_9FIRM|nr:MULTISPECIES: hypothetical protein [Anaerotruncus]NBH62009.1 hypothetical protein [Anaerotruncus colihominis]NCF02664.1 hypothetical protein [Anaerotruncus sp. 80]